MNALREFPADPHTLVIHTDDLVTEQMIETYVRGSDSPQPEWVRAVLAVPGVRVVSLSAYKIRLQKHEDASWSEVLDPFERILSEAFAITSIDDLVESESPCRAFAWHGPPLSRRVFEGPLQAADHLIARSLFEVRGVAEVILDAHQVEVRKSPLTCWRDLSPQIEHRLAAL